MKRALLITYDLETVNLDLFAYLTEEFTNHGIVATLQEVKPQPLTVEAQTNPHPIDADTLPAFLRRQAS